MNHNLFKRCKPCSVRITRLSKSELVRHKVITSQNTERGSHSNKHKDKPTAHSPQRPRRQATPACFVTDESDVESTESDWKYEHKSDNPKNSDSTSSDDEPTSLTSGSFQEKKDDIPRKKKRKRISSSSSSDGEHKKKRESSPVNQLSIQPTPNNDESMKIDTLPQPASKQQPTDPIGKEPTNELKPQKRRSKTKSVDSETITESPKSKRSLWKRYSLQPKTLSLKCSVCKIQCENHEKLSEHVFSHTARELQNAYKVARDKQDNADSDSKVSDPVVAEQQLGTIGDNDLIEDDAVDSKLVVSTSCINVKVSSATDRTLSVAMCACHSESNKTPEEGVQIEMVLFCKICRVLFRRQECFETHYRFSPKCCGDRKKNRIPKLFCSTCLVILNGLAVMRRHLEDHASINYHGTVNFVCNICRVVFFGVGTVFCTHWFNHEKDNTFVASRHSFPKLCITNTGQKPNGCAPNEQYIFVAEYVCRICKLQFSSESELSVHAATECSLSSITTRTSRKDNKAITSKGIVNKLTPVVAKRKESKPVASTATTAPPSSSNNKTAASPDFHLICEECKEIYPNQSKFEEHFVKHFQDNDYPYIAPYVCNVCLTFYHNLKEFNRHWVTHIAVIKFICTVCNMQLSNIDVFQTHIAQSCWKQKPNCRVWFSHRHHVCKICRKNWRTMEELAKHYISDHTKETNSSITNSLRPVTPSSAPEKSKISVHESSVKNLKSVAAKLCENVENVPMSNNNISMQSSISDTRSIDKSNNKKSHSRHSSGNIESRDKKIGDKQPRLDTQIPLLQIALTNPAITANRLQSINDNNKAYHQSLTSITRSDTNLHATNVVNLDQSVIQARGKTYKSSAVRNVIQSPTKCLLQSPPGPQVVLHGAANELSSSVSEAGGNLRIVEDVNGKQKGAETIKITDDEPEIIEVRANSRTSIPTPTITRFYTNAEQATPQQVTEKTREPSVPPVESRELPESNSAANESTTNDKEKQAVEQTCRNSEDSSSTTSAKPQNFLRVKKFQDLQAVKDYICDQCRAAFDNMKSLTEHLVGHATSLLGATTPNPRPTMLAALILPPSDPNVVEIPTAPPATIPEMIEVPAGPQAMAGKRILPYIPQRVRHAEARRVSPVQQEAYQHNNLQQFNQFPMHNPQPQVMPPPQQQQQQQPYHMSEFLQFNNNQKTDSVLRSHAMAVPLPIEQTYTNAPTTVAIIDDLPGNPPVPGSNDLNKSKPIVYTCKLCKFSTFDKHHIFDHVRYNHFPNGQGPANVAPLQPAPNHVNMPLNNTTNIVYRCHVCRNYQYATYEELTWHIQTAHPTVQRASLCLSCMYCSATNFDNEISLRHHENTYHKFACKICPVRFSTVHELLNHQKSHQKILSI